MLVDDIFPARLLRRLWSKWYWIVLGGIVGGLFGWGLSLARVPEYEASAGLSIGFDYARVNEMDDTVTSYVTLRVRDLLLSDETAQSTLDALDASALFGDIPGNLPELRSRIRLVEDGSRWEIVARARTPDGAAAIANAWADSSLQGLEQAMLHAIRAAEIETAIYRAGCRLTQDPTSPGTVIWLCEVPDDALRPTDVPEALLSEARLSKGLLPAMSFSLLSRAEPPDRPVLWGRGGLILAGTLLGMWVCVLGLAFRANAADQSRGRNAHSPRDEG
jgi:uncharacterized protein involved in exopolysaccharide biosynthesis